MIDTAMNQLRYGFSLVLCRRIDERNVRRLARDMLASRAEFGPDAISRGELPSEALDPDVRRNLDERRLRRTAQLAFDTPYYRPLLERLGLTPERLTLERLAEVPPTPKAELALAPHAFVHRRSRPVFQASTTGTTGRPTSVWFSRYELELAAALAAVGFLVDPGLTPDDVVQLNLSSRANLAVANVLGACRIIGTPAIAVGLVDPDESLDRLTSPVGLAGPKARPSVLVTHPSYLGALVQRAEDRSCTPDQLGLDHVLCSGELLTDGMRRRAETTFGARVTESYAMTEIFPLAGLVCSAHHLHLSPEQGYVEVLAPDGAPARPGEVGELVVTPLFPYRDTTILLRLATGDLVRQLDQADVRCELAGIPATSRILGKRGASGHDASRTLLRRDVAEVLEASPHARLPARYAITDAGDRVELHVVAPDADGVLAAHLLERAAERGVDARVVTHADARTLPDPTPLRSDLHERSFSSRASLEGAAS